MRISGWYSVLGCAFDCVDYSRDHLEHQCEASDDTSDNHIQNDNPDSASKIKSMRHEPQKHASNAEGEADADPPKQIVYCAVLHIHRPKQE